jgi:hypothetical protein
MPPSRLKSALLNTLGALAYLFCLLQWVWTAVLFLPGIMRSDFMKQFLQKPVTPPPVTSQAVDAPVAGIIFMAIFVVLMIVATLYIIIKIPSVVGKTGSKITHKTTDLTLPIVTHHKELPAKKRLQLTARLLFIVKILLCVIPFGMLYVEDTTNIDISRDVVFIIGAVAALCSIVLFCLQAAGAKLLHTDYKQVW